MEENWEKMGGNLSKLGENEWKWEKICKSWEKMWKIQSGEKMGENL